METPEGHLRTRRLCEYPGFDYSECERGVQLLMRLEDQITDLQCKCVTLTSEKAEAHEMIKKVREEMYKQKEDFKDELQQKMMSMQAICDKQMERLHAACKAYRDSGILLAEFALEFGDHKAECDIWELRNAGRIIDMPEEELCSCDWAKNRDQLLEAKRKGENGEISDEAAEALLDKYIKEEQLAKIDVK